MAYLDVKFLIWILTLVLYCALWNNQSLGLWEWSRLDQGVDDFRNSASYCGPCGRFLISYRFDKCLWYNWKDWGTLVSTVCCTWSALHIPANSFTHINECHSHFEFRILFRPYCHKLIAHTSTYCTSKACSSLERKNTYLFGWKHFMKLNYKILRISSQVQKWIETSIVLYIRHR